MKRSELPCPSEDREQQTAIEWAAWHEGTRPELLNLFAIPNGGHRHKAVAGKLKAQGVKSGVPDLFLAWQTDTAAGLFIEMKREFGGKVSPEQKDWRERLVRGGYAHVIAKGADQAIAAIRAYLNF